MNKSEQTHTGYLEAEVIDRQINELLSKYPLEQFPEFWQIFLRTVGTTINLLKQATPHFQSGPK
jgi:hypothetical protein